MSKLLVTGLGPLLEDDVRFIGGQCLRTWHFTRPLLEAGHEVRLVTLPITSDKDKGNALVDLEIEGFGYQSFTQPDFEFIDAELRKQLDTFQPDALVGVNLVPSWVCARLPSRLPFWADLNGYEMAEKQGQAARSGDDTPVREGWARESLVARRADRLSTVSEPQKYALMGEMAGLGRLNSHTFQYPFVEHIPNAFHPCFAHPPVAKGEQWKPVLRGIDVPEDAFVLLWSGGYNYWTDPESLFDFLEAAMCASPRVHYVSTGGAITGYDERTYALFRERVETSEFRDRFHLLGWLPAGDLPRLYWEADLGLNIDAPNYETFFGARNRLNNLMVAGLPVLTTYGSEISRMIEQARCGLVCAPGDIDGLVEAVMTMVRAPEQCLKLGQRARDFVLESFDAVRLVESLCAWAEAPALAPDNAAKAALRPGEQGLGVAPGNRLDVAAAVREEHDVLALHQDLVDLRALRDKGWFQCAMGIHQMGAAVSRIFRRNSHD